MTAVILCYTCRKRISPEEIARGLHNHTGAQAPTPNPNLRPNLAAPE
jgi:hypothetical protein